MKTSWPARPVIYEINTWVWLSDLSRQQKRAITLGTVPAEQWDAIASLNVDAVWLMGGMGAKPGGNSHCQRKRWTASRFPPRAARLYPYR